MDANIQAVESETLHDITDAENLSEFILVKNIYKKWIIASSLLFYTYKNWMLIFMKFEYEKLYNIIRLA